MTVVIKASKIGKMEQAYYFFGLILPWLIFLSFFLFKTVRHYQRLTTGVTKKNLKTVLERILGQIKDNEREIKLILKKIEGVEKKGGSHFQKIGFIRYNPFKTTGGDQSFILALLDEHDDGIVITSFHSRESTRIYAKPVKKGKGGQYKLSSAEKKVVSSAKKASLL